MMGGEPALGLRPLRAVGGIGGTGLATVMILAIVGLAAGGCTDLRLHDERRYKAATGVEEAYRAIDVPGAIAAEASNLAAAAAREKELLRRNILLVHRDAALVELLDADAMPGAAVGPASDPCADKPPRNRVCHLARRIEGRLTQLSEDWRQAVRQPDSSAPRSAYLAAANALKQARDNFESQRRLFAVGRRQFGACAGGVATGADAALQEVAQAACAEIAQAEDRVAAAAPGAGLVHDAVARRDEALGRRAAAESEASAARSRYEQAKKSLAGATLPAGEPLGVAARVDQALPDLMAAAEDLEKTDLGAKLLADERIAALAELLGKVAAGRKGEAVDGTAATLAALPTLADAIDAYRRSTRPPPAPSLALEVERQTIARDAAVRGLAFDDRRIVLAEAEVAARVREHALLMRAWAGVQDYRRAGGGDSAMVATELEGTGGARVRHLHGALIAYTASVAGGRVAAEAAERDAHALRYERALDLAATNLASWDALVRAPLGELSAYYAVGITKEQIAAFFQAAALVFIGARL